MRYIQQMQLEEMLEDLVIDTVFVLVHTGEDESVKDHYTIVAEFNPESTHSGFATLITQKNDIRLFKSLDSVQRVLGFVESYVVMDGLYFSASKGFG
jgi:hypothetical protein